MRLLVAPPFVAASVIIIVIFALSSVASAVIDTNISPLKSSSPLSVLSPFEYDPKKLKSLKSDHDNNNNGNENDVIEKDEIKHAIETLQRAGILNDCLLCCNDSHGYRYAQLIPSYISESSNNEDDNDNDEKFEIAETLSAVQKNEHKFLRRMLSESKASRRTTELSPSSKTSSEEEEWWIYTYNTIGALLCIGLVALISCMFLGFLTLDALDLQIKIRASIDENERLYAKKLLPIVEQHHRLLVTLLLLNAIAYESLPIFLDSLVPSWAAILLSVTILLIFGEIIPSAIFTGPEQLRLASSLTKLMSFFLWVLYPIAYPLVKLLDRIVPHQDGDDGAEGYNRRELSALVRLTYEASHPTAAVSATTSRRGQIDPHNVRGWRALKNEIMEAVEEKIRKASEDERSHRRRRSGNAEGNFRSRSPSPLRFPATSDTLTQPGSFSELSAATAGKTIEQIAPPLHQTEIKMVEGALTMKTKCALDVYTPLREMFAVPCNMVLTREAIAEIYGEGYSRVPVYEPLPPPYEKRRCAIRGLLMTRQLIMIDWDDEREVSSLPLYTPPCVSPRMILVDLLHLLQSGGSLIAFLCARPDLATKALEQGKPIPIESGFMGLVTLHDVIESVLQERIYDEEDAFDRVMATATLQNWAANVLQKFMKKRREKLATAASRKQTKQKDESKIAPPSECNLKPSSVSDRKIEKRPSDVHKKNDEETPLLIISENEAKVKSYA